MAASQIAVGTPQSAAFLSMEYPQFTWVIRPEASNAESAWIGEIQPFASDTAACAFLHQIEEGKSIWISSGHIREESSTKAHWADALLVNMTLRCKLLILIQPAPAHPRAYLLNPLFSEHYSVVHPHPRADQSIVWNGKNIPGLCVYSASEFKFDSARDRNSQYLEQVTLYVARHLIWLRTRQLFRGFPQQGTLLHTLRPGEVLFSDKPMLREAATQNRKEILDYWVGYWPGPTAHAFDAVAHLKTIRPGEECWCGSGVSYGSCHRPDELNAQGTNINASRKAQ